MKTRNIGLTVALLALLVAPAFAVIEVKLPLAKMVATDSKIVVGGTISIITAEDKLLEVKTSTTYKGDAPAVLRIINVPADLIDQLNAKGASREVAVFAGSRSASLHIADRWYTGRPGSKPDIFILEARNVELDGTFPGTTANLLKALDEIKAGKSTLIDVFPPITLPKPQKIADLPAHSTAFTASENPREKTIEFTVTNAKDEVLSFTFDGKTLTSKNPSGVLNFSGKIEIGTPGAGKIFAVTEITPADGAKPDSAFIVTTAGLFRGAINNPPAPIDDDLRLTGSKITSFYPAHKNGFTSATIVSVDLNNDGRPDLIILTPEGTLTLLNRGFGCYLVNKNIAAPLLEPVTPVPPSTTAPAVAVQLPLLAATAHTLYRLNPDGALYRYDLKQNP